MDFDLFDIKRKIAMCQGRIGGVRCNCRLKTNLALEARWAVFRRPGRISEGEHEHLQPLYCRKRRLNRWSDYKIIYKKTVPL
jgi:hypothetical protein